MYQLHHLKNNIVLIVLMLVLVGGGVAFSEHRRNATLSTPGGAKEEILALQQNLQIEKIEREGLETRIGNLEAELGEIRIKNEEVLSRSQSALDEIEDISNTVGALDKLTKTDPELLQKYSKSYFLNEHYIPTEITGINPAFTFPENKVLLIHVGVSPHLEDLLNDAKKEGLDLGVASAYRTFGTQSALKSSYKLVYGAGTANQFSADQGYSEHQLGTTVDFATSKTVATLAGFNQTPEYAWLVNNAHKYGFVLSYPPNNIYYQYEPWHWRFVGVELAEKLYDEGRYFYEYDQREINSYLGNIFD